ncbi:MAG: hypothetical protein PHO10_07180 [Gemmiger sp.]|nr:hypothetical protein [Gemmiger sp.]
MWKTYFYSKKLKKIFKNVFKLKAATGVLYPVGAQAAAERNFQAKYQQKIPMAAGVVLWYTSYIATGLGGGPASHTKPTKSRFAAKCPQPLARHPVLRPALRNFG